MSQFERKELLSAVAIDYPGGLHNIMVYILNTVATIRNSKLIACVSRLSLFFQHLSKHNLTLQNF